LYLRVKVVALPAAPPQGRHEAAAQPHLVAPAGQPVAMAAVEARTQTHGRPEGVSDGLGAADQPAELADLLDARLLAHPEADRVVPVRPCDVLPEPADQRQGDQR